MDNFDRLDRIEVLLEKIGQRVDSNAKAIEAISAYTTEYQKDRAQMYQLMADLAQTQADLAQAQADLAQAQAEGKREMYRMLGNLDQQQAQFSQQQAEIVQILKLLVQQKKDEAI
jgi:predicted unusual protein kinase regulating ubiquinone biosynthesis (AarF/ABC1/UbiB family)